MNINTLTGLADAVAWTNKTLDLLKVGGKWIVPRSGTVVTVLSHYPKKCAVTDGQPDESIRKVLKAAGWEIVDN